MRGNHLPDGFSLIEVVLALGICAFVLVALLGLFSTGLRASRESEEQVQAANLASQILATRLASPLSDTNYPDIAIPASALTNAYGDVFSGEDNFVSLDGRKASSSNAAYRIFSRAGTNATTGPRLSQVYLMLSWPPQAPLKNSAGRYETLSYIPLY